MKDSIFQALFCVLLFKLNIVSWKSLHIETQRSSLFFFTAAQCSIVWMYHSFPMYGTLDCFHDFAITINASVSNFMYIIFILLEVYLQGRLLEIELLDLKMGIYVRSFHIFLQKDCTNFVFPPVKQESACFPRASLTECVVTFKIFCQSNCEKWLS